MKDFLNSNIGKNITNTIVRYRNWAEPLNARKQAIISLKGEVDDKSMDTKRLMQTYILKRLNNPTFVYVKAKFQKDMETLLDKLKIENIEVRKNFIEVIDYNFLEPSENVAPILTTIIKKIYEVRREKEVA